MAAHVVQVHCIFHRSIRAIPSTSRFILLLEKYNFEGTDKCQNRLWASIVSYLQNPQEFIAFINESSHEEM